MKASSFFSARLLTLLDNYKVSQHIFFAGEEGGNVENSTPTTAPSTKTEKLPDEKVYEKPQEKELTLDQFKQGLLDLKDLLDQNIFEENEDYPPTLPSFFTKKNDKGQYSMYIRETFFNEIAEIKDSSFLSNDPIFSRILKLANANKAFSAFPIEEIDTGSYNIITFPLSFDESGAQYLFDTQLSLSSSSDAISSTDTKTVIEENEMMNDGIKNIKTSEQLVQAVLDFNNRSAQEKLDPILVTTLRDSVDTPLGGMLNNLLGLTFNRWNNDPALQQILLGSFIQEANKLKEEYNSFVDSSRKERSIGTIFADGQGKIEFKKDDSIIATLSSRGWEAFETTLLESQLSVIGMSLDTLRKQILDSLGDKELSLGELIRNSDLKGKKWEEISENKKIALTQILLEVKNLQSKVNVKTETLTREPVYIRPEFEAYAQETQQNLKTFENERAALLISPEFQREIADYVNEFRSLVMGSQIFFGNKFDSMKVKLPDGTTLNLANQVFHFKNPAEAQKFQESVLTHLKTTPGQKQEIRLDVSGMLKNPDGSLKITKTPETIDFSILEEGWNIAYRLFQLSQDSRASAQDKQSAFDALKDYMTKNDHLFSSPETLLYLKSQSSSVAQDIARMIDAVRHTFNSFQSGNAIDRSIFFDGDNRNLIGLNRIAYQSVVIHKNTLSNPDFLAAINYGKKDTLRVQTTLTQTAEPIFQEVRLTSWEISSKTPKEQKQIIQDFLAQQASNQFFRDMPADLNLNAGQGISYLKSKQYFENKLQDTSISPENQTLCMNMLAAITVIDQLYTDGRDAAAFSYAPERFKDPALAAVHNSKLGAEIIAQAYGIDAAADQQFITDMKTVLEYVNPNNTSTLVENDAAKSVLEGSYIETLRRDQGVSFLDTSSLLLPKGSAFSGTLQENYFEGFDGATANTKKPHIFLIEGGFKEKIVLHSPTAKEMLRNIGITNENKSSFEVQQADGNWTLIQNLEEIFNVALVSIPGRLNESLAFKLKNIRQKIEQTVEIPLTQDIPLEMPPLQTAVIDVFRTYDTKHPGNWLGNMLVDTRQMLGNESKLYRDFQDSTGIRLAGKDGLFSEDLPSEKRLQVITETIDASKSLRGKVLKKADEKVGQVPLSILLENGRLEAQYGFTTLEAALFTSAIKSYLDSTGPQHFYLAGQDVNALKNLSWAEFKQKVETLKQSSTEKPKSSTLVYENGMVVFPVNAETLTSPYWTIRFNTKNNPVEYIINRMDIPVLSQDKFDRFQQEGQFPQEISGIAFNYELYKNLVRGEIASPVLQTLLGTQSGILKIAQPVQINREIIGMVFGTVVGGTIVDICRVGVDAAVIETGGSF